MIDDRRDGGPDPTSSATNGTAAAGIATVGFAVSGTSERGGGSGGGKSGGRGQTSDEVRLNVPFEVDLNGPVQRNVSSMSNESAQQGYDEYEYHYCDEDEPPGTFRGIPDRSDLNEDRTYEFRSVQDGKESGDFTEKFSFGPANSDCPE